MNIEVGNSFATESTFITIDEENYFKVERVLREDGSWGPFMIMVMGAHGWYKIRLNNATIGYDTLEAATSFIKTWFAHVGTAVNAYLDDRGKIVALPLN
jgi:hypothetical protein